MQDSSLTCPAIASGAISSNAAPAKQASTLVRKASFLDSIGFMADVIFPTLAKGVIIRRPFMVALAEYFDLDRRAVRRMQQLRYRYGTGPLLIQLPGRTLALILDPRHVHRVLAESPEPFATETREKRAALAHFEPKNVLISHGSERAERRRFHEEALDSHSPVHRLADGFLHVVNSEAEHLRKDLRSRAELTWDDFSEAWFRIIRQVVFGRAARDDNELSRIMAKLRSSGNWAFLRPQRRGLRDQLLNRIRGYLEQADPDSLSGVMARFHADGEIAPEHQVPQWLFAFDPAGMTTFRTLALLATHPKHARTAREEITHDTSAQGLSFLRAAVLESLRLWPTSPLVLRESTQPTAWETGVIPAHAGIVIYSPFFHRDNERLPYADKFSPEIWLDSTTGPGESLIPFSEGPAICPGRNLVLLISTAMLAAILRSARVNLKHAGRLNPDASMPGTLNPYTLRFNLRD